MKLNVIKKLILEFSEEEALLLYRLISEYKDPHGLPKDLENFADKLEILLEDPRRK